MPGLEPKAGNEPTGLLQCPFRAGFRVVIRELERGCLHYGVVAGDPVFKAVLGLIRGAEKSARQARRSDPLGAY